ncbi:MAG TPA: hypothetical protein VHA54_05730 [Solirubrobacterales bacterium]|nr:hypothetical protein [Solirubrobacterales bacterium]
MSGRSARRRGAAAALIAAALLLAVGWAGAARGERTQDGDLIVSLDGAVSPLKLPRQRPAPVSVHLDGGLRTADGSLLPRVTRVELGLPDEGVLSTRGLPVCPARRLRSATTPQALESCRGALVGRGRIEADVLLPNQDPFTIRARLLAFNGRAGGRRAVLLHAFAAVPPTVVVLPFVVRRGGGRLGTRLVADLPPSLGPWPHFAHFEMTLSRRYTYRGRQRSYISATCPIPPRFTAGFATVARAAYTLLGGRRVSTEITRGCRAEKEG